MKNLKIKLSVKPVAKIRTGVTNPVVTADVTAVILKLPKIKDTDDICYVANINNKSYPITDKSFIIAGRKIVYSKFKDEFGNYIKIARGGLDINSPMTSSHYSTVKHKLVVKGNLIIKEGKTMFDITDYNND